jgi:hypothetical protein
MAGTLRTLTATFAIRIGAGIGRLRRREGRIYQALYEPGPRRVAPRAGALPAHFSQAGLSGDLQRGGGVAK